MINYKGDFESKKDVAISNLPAGAYVGKVMDAYIEKQIIAGNEVERLTLKLDVTEGEYAYHYQKLFEASQGGMYAVKWKGFYRITIPQPGDRYEAMSKRILQGAAWAFEESNKGYKWDFDESKLKGLYVGFSVREADYLIDDAEGVRTGTMTEICKLESVQEVRAGSVKPAKKRELKESQKQRLEEYGKTQGMGEIVYDEDPPF